MIETIEGEVKWFTRMRLVKVRMSRQTRTMITVDEEEEEDDLLQRTRNDGHATTQQERSLGHDVRIDLGMPVWTKRRLTRWKTGSRGQEGETAPGWWTPTTSCTGRSTSPWRTPASARWRLRTRSQCEAERFLRGGSQLLHLLFLHVAWSEY